MHLYLQEQGVNLLNVRGSSADKYALNLMDVLFTEDELATRCYEVSKRTTKPGLDPKRVQLLEGKEIKPVDIMKFLTYFYL